MAILVILIVFRKAKNKGHCTKKVGVMVATFILFYYFFFFGVLSKNNIFEKKNYKVNLLQK